MQNSNLQPDITLLIQDLLSNSNTILPKNILNLISYHLSNYSTLEGNNNTILSNLINYISLSPSLWSGKSIPITTSNVQKWSTLEFKSSQEIYTSLINGIIYRSITIQKELDSSGWSARKKFTQFLELYYAGLSTSSNTTNDQEGVELEQEELIHPTIKLIMITAPLAALQIMKQRKDKLFVGGSNLMGRAEIEFLQASQDWFKVYRIDQVELIDSDDILPIWLASQVLPTFPASTLSKGPIISILSLLLNSFRQIFNQGHLFSTLSSDLSLTESTPPLLKWTIPSPSHTTLSSLSTAPLFLNLGLISRSIGRALESVSYLSQRRGVKGSKSDLERRALESIGKVDYVLLNIVERIQRDWSLSPWSEISTDEALEEITRGTNLPFGILKALLFSIVLIQSSYLTLLSPSSTSPSSSTSTISNFTSLTSLSSLYSPSLKPTLLQSRLAREGLKILGMTFFIASKFGTEGFGAWNGVLVGLIEVVGLGGEAEAERLMRELEVNRFDVIHEREVERSEVTFYLNVAEHLMKCLGNTYVEEKVLICCHPYLEDPKYRETFESAHSVLLAIFANEKKCANNLAPWYTQLLLSAYPNLMTASQLRLAFTTMIRCVSTTDDALAWYCILELISTIESIPTSTIPSPSLPSSPSPSLTIEESTTSTSRTFDPEEPTTRLSEASNLSPLELSALKSERGHLLLTLIDQLTSVNLILLRSLLGKIWNLIKLEKYAEEGGEEGEGREALMKVVFNTLGEGLDDTKREEGVRFWLERGEELAL